MQSALHAVVGPAGPEQADLKGKVAVITGGALGIGLEAARFYARYGAHCVLVNRKEDQGQAAIEKLKEECKSEGKEASVEWVGCDLGDMKQVKEVFGGLSERLDRVDIVR